MRLRIRSTSLAALAVAVIFVLPSATTLARYTASDASTGSFASDTLAPPTGVGAAGGAQITLTWTATVDTYAAGYHVYRATSSGGTYSLVATVTPRSTVTYVDNPGNGTFWYRIRAYFQNWESVDSSTVSATSGTTLFIACASQAADTTGAGDNNGYEGNASRICTDDSSFATDSNSGTGGTQSCGTAAVPDATKDRHRAWGYSLGLPGSVTSINGIRVRADLAVNAVTGSTNLCAQLSWDGGTTWTSLKTQAITVAGETTYVFGATNDTWGRSWTLTQLNTTNFRVRFVDASTVTSRVFSLDYVAVSVTYTP
jgi:hypothetical protein